MLTGKIRIFFLIAISEHSGCYSAVKENGTEALTSNIRGAFQHLNTGFRTQGPVKSPVLYLLETGQVVRSVGPSDVPEEAYAHG